MSLLVKEFKSAAFSSTGKYFALSSNSKIVLYDQDWNILWQEHGVNSGLLGQLLAFSPDDQYLAFARHGSLSKVGILDLSRQEIISSFDVRQGLLRSISFSPNGKFLVTGSNGGAIVWKASSRLFPRLELLKGHKEAVDAISFSSSGKYLVTAAEEIKVWLVSGDRFTNVLTFEDRNFDPVDLTFNSTEKFLYACGSNQIKIWQIKGIRFQPFKVINTEQINGWSISVANEGNLFAVAGFSSTVKTYLFQDDSYYPGPDLNGHEANVYNLAFSPNGKYLATGGYDRAVRIWRLGQGETEPVSDTEPPQIQITKPEPQRGFKIKQNKKQVLVEGIVTDDSPIESVLVNGKLANLDHSTGKFQLDLSLAGGVNRIKVVATDVFQNSAQKLLEVLVEKLSNSLGVYHALLIAVQEYQHPSITDLEFPLQDTQRLATVIKEEYQFDADRVQILSNPTRV